MSASFIGSSREFVGEFATIGFQIFEIEGIRKGNIG
jgi:hypothetical protein